MINAIKSGEFQSHSCLLAHASCRVEMQ